MSSKTISPFLGAFFWSDHLGILGTLKSLGIRPPVATKYPRYHSKHVYEPENLDFSDCHSRNRFPSEQPHVTFFEVVSHGRFHLNP